MRWGFVLALLAGVVALVAACGGSETVPDTTSTGMPQTGDAQPIGLKLANTRADLNFPSQLQFLFSLRDHKDDPIVVPAEDIKVRVFERETDSDVWEEIDYTETSLLVRSAQSFQIETVFVLDFTASIADEEFAEGRSGLEAMADAFRSAATVLPQAHRIGVVEFHDRNADPMVISELTTDRDTLITTLISSADGLSGESGSSRLWDGIATGVSLLGEGQRPGVVKALVFISDGETPAV